MTVLFDVNLRALRRDRAAKLGPELFLFERTFDDCLERVALVPRKFERALLIGCPDAGWPARLRNVATEVDAFDPGQIFAERARGKRLVEDDWLPSERSYDLVFAICTLDTVNNLPRALRSFSTAMTADALLIGAMSGGDTLPKLRSAMRAADQVMGAASAHVHPRIEASALAPLLSAAGFVSPVVDVDRVHVAYPSLQKLVADLRAMGATNILAARSRKPLSRSALAAASDAFMALEDGARRGETFEILHFAAWTASRMPRR